MTIKDFISILCDGIQEHEGWKFDGSASWSHLNPGNLRYVGQPTSKVVTIGSFCAFPDFYTGREALEHDIEIKFNNGYLDKSIKDLISRYAPPTENDVDAYVKAIIGKFNERGMTKWGQVVPENAIISDILKIDWEVVVICLNRIYEPDDWALAQKCIALAASYMPGCVFTTRYSNEDLQPRLEEVPAPGGLTYQIVNKAEVQFILSPINEGQKFNILFFNTKNIQFKDFVGGGAEYPHEAVSFKYLFSAFASVQFTPGQTADWMSRLIFHELIHELFTLTGNQDYLHTYLQQNGGYGANSLTDLNMVYAQEKSQYQNLSAKVVKLQEQEIGLLQQFINWLLNKIKGRNSQQ